MMQLEAAALRSRKELGLLSCRLEGRGPTGGFCMRNALSAKAPPNAAPIVDIEDIDLVESLAKLFAGSAVLDIGCGVGTYGRWFAKHAPSVRWTGVDGSEGIEEATQGFVHFADLAAVGLPRSIRQATWDWTYTLQVAEHVPPAAEAAFMHTLVSNARIGVVITWAQLAQQGLMHVNCQTPAYVQCTLRYLGFEPDGSHGNPRMEGRIFRRQPSSKAAVPPAADAAFVDAYRRHTREVCGYTTWGYLAPIPRRIRQLAARNALLGAHSMERACDAPHESDPGMWLGSGRFAWWRTTREELRVEQLANATFKGGMKALIRAEHDLYDVLASEEVAPSNRAVLKRLAKQTFGGKLPAPQQPAVHHYPTASLPMLTVHNATLENYQAWLNHTIWRLCVPPTEGFCFYSRSISPRSASGVRAGNASRHKVRGHPKACSQ